MTDPAQPCQRRHSTEVKDPPTTKGYYFARGKIGTVYRDTSRIDKLIS